MTTVLSKLTRYVLFALAGCFILTSQMYSQEAPVDAASSKKRSDLSYFYYTLFSNYYNVFLSKSVGKEYKDSLMAVCGESIFILYLTYYYPNGGNAFAADVPGEMEKGVLYIALGRLPPFLRDGWTQDPLLILSPTSRIPFLDRVDSIHRHLAPLKSEADYVRAVKSFELWVRDQRSKFKP